MRLKLALAALTGVFLLLAGFRPDALPYPHQDARFSDAVISHWPNALFLRESVLEDGRFPLWRETIMAGQPFAANPLNKTAYPFQWLALLLPPALHLNILIGLHLGIAGAGMWRWARLLGLRAEAAAFTALAYTLAPRLLAHLGAGHLDILYALAWWPWLMGSIHSAAAKPQSWARHVLSTALFAALLLLADLRLSLFALIIAAIYELASLAQTNRLRQMSRRLLIVPLFFLLTAALLAPLIAWQPHLNRADLRPAEAGVFSLEWGHLAGLILPSHAGNFETLTYLGLPVLALAVIGFLGEGRRTLLWLALAALALLYAFGLNGFLWPLLVEAVPGLLWFRVPSRAWLVIVLIAALMSGYGMSHLLGWAENIQSSRRLVSTRLAAFAGIAGSLTCGGFALISAWQPRAEDAPVIPTTPFLSLLLIGTITGLIFLSIANSWIKRQWIAPALLAITFADLTFTGTQLLGWRGPDIWLDPYRRLAERLAAENPARIYSPSYSLEQQVAAAYDLRLFGGVDPFQVRGVVHAIEQGSGVPSTGYSVVLPPLQGITSDADIGLANQNAVIDTTVLAKWQVSHVAAAYAVGHPRLEWVDTVDGVYLYRNLDYMPPSNPAELTWPEDWPDLPDRQTVDWLDQITIRAALVSGVSLVLCLLGLWYVKLRSHD